MKILSVEPFKAPQLKEIGNSLADLQHEVGGMIEEICPWDAPIALICNENGKTDKLPLNRPLYDDNGKIFDIVAGDFFLCGTNGENFTDFPVEYLETFCKIFRLPEVIF